MCISVRVELLKSVLVFVGAVLKLHEKKKEILLFEEVQSASKELSISFKVWLLLQEYNQMWTDITFFKDRRVYNEVLRKRSVYQHTRWVEGNIYRLHFYEQKLTVSRWCIHLKKRVIFQFKDVDFLSVKDLRWYKTQKLQQKNPCSPYWTFCLKNIHSFF